MVSTKEKRVFSLYGYIVPYNGTRVNMQSNEQFFMLENMLRDITRGYKVCYVAMMGDTSRFIDCVNSLDLFRNLFSLSDLFNNCARII